MRAIQSVLYSITTILLLTLIACSSGESSTQQPDSAVSFLYQYEQPKSENDGWQTGHIRDYQVDEHKLSEMMDAIDNGQFTKIDSVLIARSNTLIFDELLRTSLDAYDGSVGNSDLNVHTLQSVSKSFVSALVGIAIDQGYIADVEVPFYDFFTHYGQFDNWDSRKNQMTLENVLTMRHGWLYDEWSGTSLSDIYNNSPDNVKGLLDLPMASDPGTTFAYSTVASIALGAAVENAAGISLESFAEQYLFSPLGIDSQIWWQTTGGRAHTGGGLFLSGRDMLKFGQLFLNGGEWNGVRIISQSWVNQSIAKRVDLSLDFASGYGYQWWRQTYRIDTQAPIDTFFAAGNGGQFIFIVPEKNAVIVFTGNNINDPVLTYQPTSLMQNYILPALN